MYPSVHGHLGCYNAAMNMCAQDFIWTDVLISPRYIQRSIFSESEDISKFNLLKNY